MAARLIDAAFAFVYLRLLGRDDVGAYTFLVVFTTYLDTLIDFGLNALLAREVSRGNVAPSVAFRTVNLVRLVLWLVGLPLVAVAHGPPGATAIAPKADHAGSNPHPIKWVRESWPLFVNQLLQGLFFKIDALLLPALAGTAAAGVYAAAYKVSEGAGIVSSSFTLALFPRLARATDFAAAYRLALRVLLQVSFPLAAGIALLAEPIVAVVGGRDYLPDSAVALAILICYLPLSYANGLTQYVLIAAGRQRLLTGAFVAALIFN